MISLPIDEFLPHITRSLATKDNLVVTAAPGAGKTTRLPPALISALKGTVLVLEPRRMAAIAAAHRIAEEQGWQIGAEVGYQVRFANKTSAQTRLIFMTEALLARRLMDDPELAGVDAVVLDEFHERSLHVDLALGLLRELQELGRKIHLVVMSATLEADKISAFLGGAPVFAVPGKLFELKTIYQKNSQLLQTHQTFYENLAATVREAQAATSHDLLVFLPGVGEIERARQNLESWAEGKGIDLIPLHGSLPLEDQRRALQKGPRPRIVLSTNIAESSVTVDGVNTVIDSGLAKVMKQDLRTGFSRLEVSRISLSSAIQRSGRAARQFPGVSYRMWNKLDETSFPKSEVPEILRSDLSESLLFLAAQGVRDFENFSWFEKPSKLVIERAVKTLTAAGALNESDGVITVLGRQMLHFPLPVRLARLMIAGGQMGELDLAARICALLQERDILRKEASAHFVGDRLECDLTARLEVLEQFLKTGKPRDAHYVSLQNVAQSYRQILQLGKELLPKAKVASGDFREARQALLLAAYRDRLCRRRKNSERALMTGGRGVKLTTESLVRESEFFIALNGVEGSQDAETLVGMASAVDRSFLFAKFGDEIQKRSRIIFDEDRSQFYREEFKAWGDLPLDEPVLSQASPDEVGERLPEILAQNFARVLKENPELARWTERILFLYRHRGQIPEKFATALEAQWPSVFSEAGEFTAEFKLSALGPACLGETKMPNVFAKDLVYFFEQALAPEMRDALGELPARLKIPSGSLIPVFYPADKPPYLEVRIQEIFGWTQTPKVLWSQIPVTLHLLGPNFRPVQVTSHLESFWQNGYAEVRKELRIRYPKHQWPEDPRDGVAEAKGRRRP